MASGISHGGPVCYWRKQFSGRERRRHGRSVVLLVEPEGRVEMLILISSRRSHCDPVLFHVFRSRTISKALDSIETCTSRHLVFIYSTVKKWRPVE